MPLPLIPLIVTAAAGAAGGFGLTKLVQGIFKNITSGKINKEATTILETAQAEAVLASNESEQKLDELGKIKLNVLDKSMSRFVAVFDKIHNIELRDSVGLEELGKYGIDKQSVIELREMSTLAKEAIGGLLGGAGAGALTAFGAYGATMTFASASTGTAIATLSGIAAKNATLAFLGGGALAAGSSSGGMALGAVVLGGLVVAPAFAIFGLAMDASARKNLEKALSNKAEASKVAEELKLVVTACNGIGARADMFRDLLSELDAVFVSLISQLEFIVSTKGEDYGQYNEAEQNRVAMAMSVAGAVKKVLDTPILDEEGGVTEESEQAHTELNQYLGNVQHELA